MEQTDSNKLIQQTQYGNDYYYTFDSLNIRRSRAVSGSGGAIYLKNINKISIRNSRISENYAYENGGGMFIECPAPYACEILMRDWNNFT